MSEVHPKLVEVFASMNQEKRNQYIMGHYGGLLLLMAFVFIAPIVSLILWKVSGGSLLAKLFVCVFGRIAVSALFAWVICSRCMKIDWNIPPHRGVPVLLAFFLSTAVGLLWLMQAADGSLNLNQTGYVISECINAFFIIGMTFLALRMLNTHLSHMNATPIAAATTPQVVEEPKPAEAKTGREVELLQVVNSGREPALVIEQLREMLEVKS